MLRRTFDTLASSAGLLLAALLILLGILGLIGYNFVANQVTTQLTEQKIVFPAAGSAPLTALPPADRAAMSQYAGQMMTNGYQAQTYANNFIAVHLRDVAGGKTYAQVSAEALANPTNPTLAKQAATLFEGTTLRGLLLNAYAFWTLGQIVLIAAICSLVVGGILLLLSILGFLHSRRAGREARVGEPSPQRVR